MDIRNTRIIIFIKLSIEDIISLSRVCKIYNKYVREDEYLWKLLYQRDMYNLESKQNFKNLYIYVYSKKILNKSLALKNGEYVGFKNIKFMFEKRIKAFRFAYINLRVSFKNLIISNLNIKKFDISEYKFLFTNQTDTFSLRQNKLTNVDDCFNQTGIKEFDFSHNLIEKINPPVNYYTIKYLNLCNNGIKCIKNICRIESLVHLDVSFNLIEYIPEEIGNLFKLLCLNLEYNKIKYLPQTIMELKDLKYLYIKNTLIREVFVSADYTDLEQIDIFPENLIIAPPYVNKYVFKKNAKNIQVVETPYMVKYFLKSDNVKNYAEKYLIEEINIFKNLLYFGILMRQELNKKVKSAKYKLLIKQMKILLDEIKIVDISKYKQLYKNLDYFIKKEQKIIKKVISFLTNEIEKKFSKKFFEFYKKLILIENLYLGGKKIEYGQNTINIKFINHIINIMNS